MDIAYLLWLQGIRAALPDFVEEFFLTVSAIAASEALVLVVALIYWCMDKELGKRLVFSFGIGALVTNTTKVIACINRPWILSERIVPSAKALPGATGYSFPSGHTQAATSLFGTAAWYERKRSKVLAAVLAAFVVAVAFSRNFLGVHTPQDVLVGFIIGAASIAAAEWFLTWVDEREGRDLTVLVASLVAIVALTIFVLVKPYPMTYDATGMLIVDPIEMQVDFFKTAGIFAGIVTGWFLERRLVSFPCDPKMGWKRIVIRLVVGTAVLALCYLAAQPLKMLGADVRIYQFVKLFLVLLAASFLSPLAFTKVEGRLAD